MSEIVNSLLEMPDHNSHEPPTIVLGQFERVGSTFYLDQLEKRHIVHNEPYRLLIPDSWPISREYNGRLQSVDEFFANPEVSGIDKHWFRNFFVSLHYPGAQIVKETNVFLALPQLLELFPKSPVRLLTRNPLGIASSFKRNDLYNRWRYDQVAHTLDVQLDAGKQDGHEAMLHMVRQDGEWFERLTWLMGLNSVLLSRHIDMDRVTQIIRYEEDVIPLSTDETVANDRVQDSIFATNIIKERDDFEARLSDDELRLIGKAMEECANFVGQEFDSSDQVLFPSLFSRHIGSERVGSTYEPSARKLGQVSVATETSALLPITVESELDSELNRSLERLVSEQTVLWDRSLVTNEQMGRFLKRILEHGHNPVYNYLLFMEHMPPSRGGRISYEDENDILQQTVGFDDHPVYWISWMAASLYAYSQGMRLPYYSEWHKAYLALGEAVHVPDANHSYASDDTTPTGQGEGEVPDDFFGNLKIWCQDWSGPEAVSKKLAGISWKHYMHPDYQLMGERPYLTNSRVIGARLVCCSECPRPQQKSMDEVMARLNEVVDIIESTQVQTAQDLTQLNHRISDVLSSEPCAHEQKEQRL